VCWDTERTE